jgi:hypothetical protein
MFELAALRWARHKIKRSNLEYELAVERMKWQLEYMKREATPRLVPGSIMFYSPSPYPPVEFTKAIELCSWCGSKISMEVTNCKQCGGPR